MFMRTLYCSEALFSWHCMNSLSQVFANMEYLWQKAAPFFLLVGKLISKWLFHIVLLNSAGELEGEVSTLRLSVKYINHERA